LRTESEHTLSLAVWGTESTVPQRCRQEVFLNQCHLRTAHCEHDPSSVADRNKKMLNDDQAKKLLVAFEVTGVSPLLQNNLAEPKSKQPRDCVEAATFRNVDGKVCMPPGAFRGAILSAAVAASGFKKPELRMHFSIEGLSIPITYRAMYQWMEMIRTGGMSRLPDVRFRPSFEDWGARLAIRFDETLDAVTVGDLLNRAGQVGVGAYRPERDGSFGEFRVTRHIDDPKEIAEVRAACAVAPAWLEPEAAHRAAVRRSTQFNFRLSNADVDRLRAVCQAKGVNASSVVRMLIKREYDREESARVTSGLCG
jgi:hypothetical protein